MVGLTRRNSNSSNNFGPPFSQFFQSFEDSLEKILNPRQLTNQTYVSVPHTEEQLLSFIKKQPSGLCILNGLRGSGKTTTSSYIYKKYRQSKQTFVLYFDARRYGSSTFPKELYKSTTEERLRYCEAKTREIIASNFTRTANNLIDRLNIQFDINNLIYYSIQNHSHVIPKSILRRYNLGVLMDHEFIETAFDCDNIATDSLAFVKMLYLMNKYTVFNKVILFIDNCDQLEYEVLEGYIHAISHFIGCSRAANQKRRRKGEIINRIKLKSIITCRPYNLEKLLIHQERTSMSSHDVRLVNHDNPPNAYDVIKKRAGRRIVIKKYNFRSGMRIENINETRAINGWIKNLHDAGCLDILHSLHNDNLSDSLSTIINLAKNNYFPRYDEHIARIAKIKIESGEINDKYTNDYRVPFTMHIFLRCCLYGNKNKSRNGFYPVSGTEIPNILDWDGSNPWTLLLKLRLYEMIRSRGGVGANRYMINTAVIYNDLNKCIPIDESTFMSELHWLHGKKLIASFGLKLSEKPNLRDAVCVTNRFETVVDLMSRYVEVIDAFCDDLCIHENPPEKTTRGDVKNPRIKEILNITEMIFKVEKNQLNLLREEGKFDDFRILIGRTLWSKKIKDCVQRYLDRAKISSDYKLFSDIDSYASEITDGSDAVFDCMISAKNLKNMMTNYDSLQKYAEGGDENTERLIASIGFMIANEKKSQELDKLKQKVSEISEDIRAGEKSKGTIEKLKEASDIVIQGDKFLQSSEKLIGKFKSLSELLSGFPS